MDRSTHRTPIAGAAGEAAGKLAFWRSVPIFRHLSDPVCLELSSISRRQRWAAGALIFQRGDDSNYMVAVEKGKIRLALQTSGGREFALRYVGQGALFGEIGILDGAPRSADASAVVSTWGYVIERRQFLHLIHKHPEIADATIQHLCSLLRYTTEHIETIALYGLEGRLARFLLSQLRPDIDIDIPGEQRLQLDLSQSDIAELLGASRPKVNRAIATLEKAGAIRRDGKAIYCSLARLIRVADPDE